MSCFTTDTRHAKHSHPIQTPRIVQHVHPGCNNIPLFVESKDAEISLWFTAVTKVPESKEA